MRHIEIFTCDSGVYQLLDTKFYVAASLMLHPKLFLCITVLHTISQKSITKPHSLIPSAYNFFAVGDMELLVRTHPRSAGVWHMLSRDIMHNVTCTPMRLSAN